MSANEVIVMLAHILSDQETFQLARTDLDPRFFEQFDEQLLINVWESAVALFDRHGEPPSSEAIRLQIINMQSTDMRMNNISGMSVHGADAVTALMNQIAESASVPMPGLGKQLLARFLEERGIVWPIVNLVRQAGQSSAFPAEFPDRLRQATAELDELRARYGDAESWGQIIPLDGEALPPFPTDALPNALRDWVEAEAESTQTPADLAGLLAIAVCGAAAAKAVEIVVKDDWREPINLFVVVGLEPGNRKSAVFRDATRPLASFEANLVASTASRVRADNQRANVLETRQENLLKQASRQENPVERDRLIQEAGRVSDELANAPRTVAPRLVVDDLTVEKLEILLAEQRGRMAVMSAEGGGVFGMIKGGRYGKAASFDVYLKGHAGDDLRVDRVNRASVFVANPATFSRRGVTAGRSS